MKWYIRQRKWKENITKQNKSKQTNKTEKHQSALLCVRQKGVMCSHSSSCHIVFDLYITLIYIYIYTNYVSCVYIYVTRCPLLLLLTNVPKKIKNEIGNISARRTCTNKEIHLPNNERKRRTANFLLPLHLPLWYNPYLYTYTRESQDRRYIIHPSLCFIY